jgi:monovalent cation:H+ antiporter-2, CPA2 family
MLGGTAPGRREARCLRSASRSASSSPSASRPDVGPRFVPWLLGQAARTGSHELFTLCVLAIALGIAYGAPSVRRVVRPRGVRAGIVLAKSELSHRAAEESLPLQHAFAVLFFVSVGMLFDPSILVREPAALVACC